MGYFLLIAGVLLMLFGFGGAANAWPGIDTVMQQAVVALWVVQGALGLIVFGLGGVINAIRSRTSQQASTRGPESRTPNRIRAPAAEWPFGGTRDRQPPPGPPSYDR
jgi:hypothetical protein